MFNCKHGLIMRDKMGIESYQVMCRGRMWMWIREPYQGRPTQTSEVKGITENLTWYYMIIAFYDNSTPRYEHMMPQRCPWHVPDNDPKWSPNGLQVVPKWTPSGSYVVPKWSTCDFSVSYLISSKCLIFKNFKLLLVGLQKNMNYC